MELTDKICADEIIPLLPADCSIGRRIICLAKIPSTQLMAKDIAKSSLEGTVILSEEQTAGMGRFERTWHSASGGLWFSIIFKPRCIPSNISQIPLIFAIAICRVIEKDCAKKALIKWPNDVFVDGKKVAGIVADMSADVGRVNWVAVGIGLNVNNKLPAELDSAASLSTLCNIHYNRATLLADIFIEIDAVYKKFINGGFAAFLQEFSNRSLLIGKTIAANSSGAIVRGTAKGFNTDGALLIDSQGKIETLLAADVTIDKDGSRQA
jgi:BirA family biotin operon repressor/biotin-[acetyl-CoA-carboxylase] ligase